MSRAIRLPRSILFQIGGLVLAAIASVLLISGGVVMLTPEPAAPRMLMSEVQAALLSADKAKQFGLDRRVSADAPSLAGGKDARLFALMLASGLNVPQDRIRFSAKAQQSVGEAQPAGAMIPVVSVRTSQPLPKGLAPAQFRLIQRSGPEVIRPGQTRIIGTPGSLPPALAQILASRPFAVADYQAAVRRADGSWVSVEPKKPWLSLWQKRLLLTLGLSFLVMAPLAWLAARRLTKPIRELASFAENTGLSADTAPPPADAPREVQAAANAIGQMRERLQDEASGRSRMLAAVAHDMRTPLTGLRLRAETAPPEERERMAADIARMEKMIGQVLAYSAGEQSDEPHEPFDLDSLVEECVRDARAQGQEATFFPGPEVEVCAAPLGLRRAVRNLLDNAHRYGGACEVRVVSDGECASVLVDDQGPGIPDDLLEKVQEPFFRGEKSRNRDTGGTGLGLAITSSIARQHGGTLVLQNREGGGLRAELRIRR
jgi:signal transduction histidine kinase